MSTPSIIQQKAHFSGVVSSLAFTSDVQPGSFLFCVCVASEPTVSDNLNGAWITLAQGEAQSTIGYTIAYLPSSNAGTITVSFSPSATLPLIAEISPSTLTAQSAVASGTLATNNATEFTSAQIAATPGQLLLGYAFGTGRLVESAGGSFALQATGTLPIRASLETQTATTGNFNSDFFTPANLFGNVWATGIVALTGAASLGNFVLEGNAGVQGATVTLSGAASATVTSDLMGNWQFAGLAAGAYTVTPTKTGYTFSPTSSNQTISTANILGVNFVATHTSDSVAFSTVDSRTSPNSQLLVGGTQLNVVPAPPSHLPPIDDRAAGAPADSRAAGAPLNSRT